MNDKISILIYQKYRRQYLIDIKETQTNSTIN